MGSIGKTDANNAGICLRRRILLAECKPRDGCAAMDGGVVQGLDGTGMHIDLFSQVKLWGHLAL